MKRYKQLTIEQRYQIYGLKKVGFKRSEIKVELMVDKETISRDEIKFLYSTTGKNPLCLTVLLPILLQNESAFLAFLLSTVHPDFSAQELSSGQLPWCLTELIVVSD